MPPKRKASTKAKSPAAKKQAASQEAVVPAPAQASSPALVRLPATAVLNRVWAHTADVFQTTVCRSSL